MSFETVCLCASSPPFFPPVEEEDDASSTSSSSSTEYFARAYRHSGRSSSTRGSAYATNDGV